jgi:16S rRNA (guanine527-N7)-methyltransferase
MAKRPPSKPHAKPKRPLPPTVQPASAHEINEFVKTYRVSRETAQRLQIFERVLLHWQKSMNLVSKSTLSEIWTRHFADSAQLLDIARGSAGENGAAPWVWLDLGSGGGLPGLVIAIMLAETATQTAPVRVILIESDARKCAFLREVLRQVGLSKNPMPEIPMTASSGTALKIPPNRGGIIVDILPTRIESPQNRATVGRVDVVSARAVAPLDVLLALSAPFFGPNTRGVFLKGRDHKAEIELAKQSWTFDLTLTQSTTELDAQVLTVSGLAPRAKPAEPPKSLV